MLRLRLRKLFFRIRGMNRNIIYSIVDAGQVLYLFLDAVDSGWEAENGEVNRWTG